MSTAPSLVSLMESGGIGYPIWCLVRTMIICAVVAAVSWAIGLPYIWPGVTISALCGVWVTANDARKIVNPNKKGRAFRCQLPQTVPCVQD